MAHKVGTAKPLVAFSWGYEGWGNHTKDLVATADAIETLRGFLPPLFVDIRIRRQVRAVGFRDRAFEEQLGPKRYRWLRGLGNRAIVADLDEDIAIDRPEDADLLLDEIIAANKARRRVIFFCSCGSPYLASACHRAEVANLLLRRARSRKIGLAIHEWPGGSPISTTVALPAKDLKRARTKDLTQVPLPLGVDVTWAAAVPHLSLISSGSGDEAVVLVSGPARRTARGWVLPVHSVGRRGDERAIQRELTSDLVDMNLAPRGARMELPKRWRWEAPKSSRS